VALNTDRSGQVHRSDLFDDNVLCNNGNMLNEIQLTFLADFLEFG